MSHQGSQNSAEVDFMKKMIDHHQAGAEMGQLGLTKATRQELKDASQKVVSSQPEEIRMMQGWLGDWYGVTARPEVKPEQRRHIEHLAGTSGSEFDAEYMKSLAKHHGMAISMASQFQGQAEHPELRTLCENIVKTQTQEVEQLQTWLRDWYGVRQELAPR